MITRIKYVQPAKSFALDESAIKVLAENPEKLDKLGIGFSDEFLAANIQNNVQMAMDAGITQPVTTPSNGTPVQYLQQILPGFINILTKVRKADIFAPIATAGQWHDAQIVMRTMEHIGTPQQYSDHGAIALASFNSVNETRDVARFELGAQMSKLADARSGAENINAANERRGAVANAFALLSNEIAWNGYDDGDSVAIYGILNDPNLPSYVTVATGAASDTTWASKTVAERISDLVTAAAALRVQAGGNVDPESDPIQIGLGLGVIDLINESDSSFSNGKTVKQWAAENYSNWTFESAPQFDEASGGDNVFYMKALKVNDSGTDGGDVMIHVQPARMQALGTEQRVKGTLEGYTSADAGVMVKRPYAVVRYVGI